MRTSWLPALVGFFSMLRLSAFEASFDPLWQKALAVARTNANWVAGLVVMRSEILHKGETNGVHELWTQSKLGTNGEVITQTIKVLEDGEDVTKEETKKEEKQKKKKAKDKDKEKTTSGQQGINPFDPESQDRVTINRSNQSRKIEGRACVGYSFEVRNTNGPTARGMAWLEKETGVPREIENMTLNPLPDKRLKSVTTTTRYETTTDGLWRVKEVRTKTKASVLFMNLDVLSTMTFSDYWKRPAR